MTAPVFDIKDAIADAVSSSIAAIPVDDRVEDTASASDGEDTTEEEPSEPNAEEAADEGDREEGGEDAGADEPATLPEGFVAVPSVEGDLATEFRLLDAEGEVEVPALMVEYKANGKVRTDRLDQVVKLAQWGVYSQERETKLKQETEGRIKEYEALVAQREQEMERLLTDDDFRERVHAAYLEENSPEKRAERAEQQVTDLQLAQQLQKIEEVGEAFFATEVEPAIRLIATALPTVTIEELEEKLEMAMMAQAVTAPNGVPYVPASRYEAIRKYIVEDLALWAQAVHGRRRQPVVAKTEKATAELERARAEAQKAKRLVGQKLKPSSGKAGAVPAGAKPSPKPATVDDAVSSALSSALANFRS